MEKLLDRINELARIKKERELTNEELEERDFLREKYISLFREGLLEQLKSIKVVNESGEDITPQKIKDLKQQV